MKSSKLSLSNPLCLLVLGMGKTGVATCECALQQGWSVQIADEQENEKTQATAKRLSAKGIKVLFTPFDSLSLSHIDLVVPSPGVSLPPSFLKEASAKEICILSEIELAFQLFPHSQIIAVTGTNGKTTTARLIHFLLTQQGKSAALCGNIGTPFIALAPTLKKETVAILEVSSFQLAFVSTFHPHLSLFLNIDEDHLDRHKNLDDYFSEKARLFTQLDASDTAILYAQSHRIAQLGRSLACRTLYFSLEDHHQAGAFLRKQEIILRLHEREKAIGTTDQLPVRTLPFLENLLAAMTCLAALPNVVPSLDAIADFNLSPHRLQTIKKVGDIAFIDDSKATNPHAVKGALLSVSPPVVLILGGKDKDLSFDPLLPLFKKAVAAFVLIGEAQNKLYRLLKPLHKPIYLSACMKDAVQCARDYASPSGTVLLSPGCASFDQYSSYEERGIDFANEVRRLG